MKRILGLLLALAVLAVPARGVEPVQYMAITFDDGPSGRFTRALLAGLEERNVKATFFLCGYRLADYGELAARIHRAGHEIGLHGYSHRDMTALSPGELAGELRDTLALLPEGGVVNLLRTPGGKVNSTVAQAAKQQHLAVIKWDTDPQDWATEDASLICRRILEQARDGSVILVHDLSDSSVAGALMAVDELQRRGVRFLTVSQLALLRLCQLESGKCYTGFPPKG